MQGFEPLMLRASVQASTKLHQQFRDVRARTVTLSEHLSDADATVQSMPDTSPVKWHLAHTTWFFETFVLTDFVEGYRPFDERFAALFNSYYESKGARIARSARGLLTRPSLEEIYAYRWHVDSALEPAIGGLPFLGQSLVELGCQHEEQHQELLLTDLLHLFAQNPLAPAAWPPLEEPSAHRLADIEWIAGKHGAIQIGSNGATFAFDCERPRHTVWLSPHALADRLVTNLEWQAFIDAEGYRRPELWLADGLAWVRNQSIEAPLYWRRDAAGQWLYQFGLGGLRPLNPTAPVSHVSYYEADAFARWRGARLPTEAEWESAASQTSADRGVLLDGPGPVQPRAAEPCSGGIRQLFGDTWEWTASAFLPYPGFQPAPGAVGEYNGKFMSGQFVLRGGSCATPRGHVRATYRNFFYPHQRWQFTGLRLAKDL